MTEKILEIDDIKVRYSGLPVLQGISLQVSQGETVSVLGSNGAGKSTLLRAVMGTQHAFEGRIRFEGREIQKLDTEKIIRLGIIYGAPTFLAIPSKSGKTLISYTPFFRN